VYPAKELELRDSGSMQPANARITRDTRYAITFIKESDMTGYESGRRKADGNARTCGRNFDICVAQAIVKRTQQVAPHRFE
jgi:hypothetical protein